MRSLAWPADDGHCVPHRDAYLARHVVAKDAMAVIESPCNNVCTVDQVSGLCIGCGRTLAEIGAWTRFKGAERIRIMADLPRRLRLLSKPRDGQAQRV